MEKLNYNILYVDDDEQNLYLFKVTFEDRYNIITVSNAEQAISYLKQKNIHIAFVDQRIPDTNGIQILEQAIKLSPNTIRILITGYSDIDVAIEAINRGAVFRYISKPWNPDDIENTIQNAIEIYNLRQRNENLIVELDNQNRLLRQKVEELNFLNILNLHLREITGKENIIARFQDILAEKFGATNFTLTEQKETTAEYTLNLIYKNNDFGYLNFDINHDNTKLDQSFLMAISNVLASILSLDKIHTETIERERFFILGKMASMIVHDLKGPLTTIGGFAELLGTEMSNKERIEYTSILKGEVTRLHKLIEELLDFARGKSHLELRQIKISNQVERIKKLFGLRLKTDNIDFKIKINTEKELVVDPAKMEKVIINLMENAIENTKNFQGERKIEIVIEEKEPYIVISIENTGKEIPHKIINRLFEPFFTYRKKNGTGLGLAICKKIVEEHNGKLYVNSGNGKTRFDIYMPLKTIEKSRES